MSIFQLRVTKQGRITLPKNLRDANRIQDGDILTFVDLGGAFLLTPRVLQMDKIADKLAQEWRTQGKSQESMLQTLQEVREEGANKG